MQNHKKLIVQTVPKSKLDFLANAPHQGVAALVAPYEYANFDEFLQNKRKKTVIQLLSF